MKNYKLLVLFILLGLLLQLCWLSQANSLINKKNVTIKSVSDQLAKSSQAESSDLKDEMNRQQPPKNTGLFTTYPSIYWDTDSSFYKNWFVQIAGNNNRKQILVSDIISAVSRYVSRKELIPGTYFWIATNIDNPTEIHNGIIAVSEVRNLIMVKMVFRDRAQHCYNKSVSA